MKKPLRIWLLMLLMIASPGCMQAVKPWERGTLAKPQMALVTDEQHNAIMQHTYTSKETSSGGYGVGGGGCGCN